MGTGRTLFWNGIFCFWWVVQEENYRNAGIFIPDSHRFYDLLHRRRSRWICGHCWKPYWNCAFSVDSIDQSLMNLPPSVRHALNQRNSSSFYLFSEERFHRVSQSKFHSANISTRRETPIKKSICFCFTKSVLYVRHVCRRVPMDFVQRKDVNKKLF